ncbi:MAG: UvrD-helicase domain-containing protein [Candidatus Krumholzibacteriia bacterium]
MNPQQKQAVLATEGPVLVLAGAGSGKTRVLTERIAYLIREKGISPERILAFTFTNKAAGEMRSRVERHLGQRELPFWIGTFHSTGVKILRREASHLDFSSNFAIYDEDDVVRLIKDVIKGKGWSLDENPVAVVRDRISRWKCALVAPQEALERAGDPNEERHAGIYKGYVDGLRKANALDFDDLIARVIELFTAHPRVKERYARQFQYVLVDEFQDTNAIQMLMIDAIASQHKNLFVVGDDDQAIYGWRGATVDNILQFDKVYEGTVVIKLEENYRSTNAILDAANRLIEHNKGRTGKSLWSAKGAGEKGKLFFVDDEEEEGAAVRETIIDLLRGGYRRSEIAVLYRTHAQSRAIENALRTGGMPYQIIGGVRFYERREIRDLLGYLKLVNNPSDNVNFKRVVNVPRRKIGDVTLAKIEEAAGDSSLLMALRDRDLLAGLPRALREKIEEFSNLVSSLQLKAREGTAHDVLLAAIEKTHYRDHLKEDPKTAETRLENIEELLVETQRFSSSASDPGLAAFLENIALISDLDSLKGEEQVALMTLHNAKGLEYRAIIITGLEEGLLPHYSSFEAVDELEEERRLFYVGITRAKERLFMFCAANRMRFGSWIGNSPSRFIGEIPVNLLDIVGGDEVPRGGLFARETQELPETPKAAGGEGSYLSRRFKQGATVIHPNYGEGTIRKVEGSGKDMKVTVHFPRYGEKKFLVAYAPFRFA